MKEKWTQQDIVKNKNRRISKSFNEIPISVSKLIDFIKKQNRNDDEKFKRSSNMSKYQKLRNSNAEVSESWYTDKKLQQMTSNHL